MVYAFIKTLHQEAAQVVFKNENSKWASSIQMKIMEEAHYDGAFDSVIQRYERSKGNMLCVHEVELEDLLPN